jgi:hypothetical protein
MGVSLVVAVTDDDWFEMLRARPDLAEVNFWAHSAASFRALQPGELFLFKLHAPRNWIVGGGVFAYQAMLPAFIAGWDAQTLKARVAFGLSEHDIHERFPQPSPTFRASWCRLVHFRATFPQRTDSPKRGSNARLHGFLVWRSLRAPKTAKKPYKTGNSVISRWSCYRRCYRNSEHMWNAGLRLHLWCRSGSVSWIETVRSYEEEAQDQRLASGRVRKS